MTPEIKQILASGKCVIRDGKTRGSIHVVIDGKCSCNEYPKTKGDEMSRKIYHFNGEAPIPGCGELAKNMGARGRLKLRIKKAARRVKRRLEHAALVAENARLWAAYGEGVK